VRITSPQVAHLFLQEKYAIGQMFRSLEKVPTFELVDVGFGDVVRSEKTKEIRPANNQLWRKYTLAMPHFECDILEVFPDRQMFVDAERWLTGTSSVPTVPELHQPTGNVNTAVCRGINSVALSALLLMASFEVWRLFWGRSTC
jgi:hypothetical protein